MQIVWTDYLKYRAQIRGFDLIDLERVLRFSGERYIDTESGRFIAIGRHANTLVLIAYEADGDVITPITIHATNRQQIRFRVRTGRLKNE